MKTFTVAAMLMALVALAPVTGAAPKKNKSGDLAWSHPEFPRFGVDRIAMIPVVTYNNDLPSEKLVEGVVGMTLHESGYRWISAGTTRELLRALAPGDSLLKAVRESVLKNARVDSVSAFNLCTRLRCDALLTVRVDQWEKRQIEWDQSGKPSTTIRLKAALVDSTGALLWSVASSETAEGPYHDANTSPIGMSGGGLQHTPVTGQGGAPDFVEVTTTVTKRWGASFPAKSAAAADSTVAAPAR